MLWVAKGVCIHSLAEVWRLPEVEAGRRPPAAAGARGCQQSRELGDDSSRHHGQDCRGASTTSYEERLYACIHIYIYMYIYVYMYGTHVYVYTYVDVHVIMCIYIDMNAYGPVAVPIGGIVSGTQKTYLKIMLVIL